MSLRVWVAFATHLDVLVVFGGGGDVFGNGDGFVVITSVVR